MATVTSDIAKMIVQYEWILENIEEEPKTIASKMILFRGERVFRVGLKNLRNCHKLPNKISNSPVVFFMAIDLNKIGMRVEGVTYGIQDSENAPSTMSQLNQEKIGDNANLQLFKTSITKQVIGNITFVFRICIAGSVSGFSYRLSDRLAKDQLWAAAKSKNSVDVEFVVKGKTFFAHKAILAARSPIFAAEFTKEQPVVADEGPHQIHIDDVELSTVEQFLYFIYTGESIRTFANEELLKLADQYQLKTLSSLCGVALKKIENTQMVSLANNLNEEAEIPSSKIRPEKETEIFFDRTTPTFRCVWKLNLLHGSQKQPPLSVMQYQNEDIFIADFTGRIGWDIPRNAFTVMYIEQPVIHCSCVKHPNLGLKIEDIYFSDKSNWFKMESKNLQKNAELSRYTIQLTKYYSNSEFYFDIKMMSTICNYYYEMMDDTWLTDFWTAATEQKFTDVEIFVGTVKVMEAHRVILSARSAVMNAAFNKTSSTGKSVVTFGAEFDVEIVKHFLNFLYTGSLKASFKSASHKQHLLKLATFYQVETLKNFCQLLDRVPDVEELTNSMLGL